MCSIYHLMEKADVKILSIISPRRCRRAGRFLVGIVPTAGAFFMTCHCAMLLSGWRVLFAPFTFKFGISWLVLITALSIAFEFCWVHRAFCLYNYLISSCIDYQNDVGFGDYLTIARLIALLLGVLLFIAFAKHRCWKDFF